jgi:hypothetical protein
MIERKRAGNRKGNLGKKREILKKKVLYSMNSFSSSYIFVFDKIGIQIHPPPPHADHMARYPDQVGPLLYVVYRTACSRVHNISASEVSKEARAPFLRAYKTGGSSFPRAQ